MQAYAILFTIFLIFYHRRRGFGPCLCPCFFAGRPFIDHSPFVHSTIRHYHFPRTKQGQNNSKKCSIFPTCTLPMQVLCKYYALPMHFLPTMFYFVKDRCCLFAIQTDPLCQQKDISTFRQWVVIDRSSVVVAYGTAR